MAKPKFIILSCDGGGVRGLITAMLLESLDAKFLQNVSLFAGTSTGSIIALGLAAGVPIKQIVELYCSMSNCNEIFSSYLSVSEASALKAEIPQLPRPPMPEQPAAGIDWWGLWNLFIQVSEQLAFPEYKSSGLQALLTKNLPAMTIAQLASQPSPKYVVVPSFQINSPDATRPWAPALFHNLPGLDVTSELSGTSLIDAAMCSAAAPLFFPPHTLSAGSFIDGGVFANNPGSTAIAAYLGSSLAAAHGADPSAVAAVSLGTGNVINSYPPANAIVPYGILGWLWPYQSGNAPAFPLIEAMFAGTSDLDDLTAKMMLRGSIYIRANPKFEQTWSLDDCAAIDKMACLTRLHQRRRMEMQAEAINALVD
jgi:predicted acylesterase/phospholipase RssA